MARIQLHRFIDLAKPVVRKDDPDSPARRNFLKSAATLAALTGMSSEAFARNFDPDAEPVRYPEPDVVVLDKRFRYKLGNTPIRRHYKGTLWAEGCAWSGVGRYLVWSDIPRNEVLRWVEEDEHVSRRHRFPSGHSNGNTFDFQGRQISFCHEPARVIRYEWNGEITVLAETFEGERFNAPNDGMVHPDDGSIWFTDPGYGALMNYEGKRYNQDPRPFRREAIYRIDAKTGKITKVADEPFKPNGMCFSHDYKKVYVADTGLSHYADKGAKSIIWVYDVDGEKLKNPRTFASMEMNGKVGFADGLRCDEDGNVWAGMGWVGDGYDGVHCFAPDGTRIGMIRMPEIVGNICFGGTKRNQLFMAASQSLYSVFVETRGAHIT
ncbi:MAG: gluconolactonase [Geminicoccaceae bacterium]|nr:MAG: gluconolactonase [Geminicoccaceae bacterium]